MKPIRLGERVPEIAQTAHETYFLELSLDDRMALARDPKKFLHGKGIPVTRSQKVSLHNHYEMPPKGVEAAGYLYAALTEENLILACVNCDSTDPEFSDHAPT